MATNVIDHNKLKRAHEDSFRDEADYGFSSDDDNDVAVIVGGVRIGGTVRAERVADDDDDDDDVEIVGAKTSGPASKPDAVDNVRDADRKADDSKRRVLEVIFNDTSRYVKFKNSAGSVASATAEPRRPSSTPADSWQRDKPATRNTPAARQESALDASSDQRRRNQANIERMLSSTRRQCIRFAADRQCFVFKDRQSLQHDPNPTEGEIAFVGIRDILRRVCYPTYRYEEALSQTAEQFPAQRVSTGLRFANHGASRGRDVHEQMAAYISKGREAWRKEYGYGCSDYVERVYSFLMSRGLKPIASEFEDYFNGLKIASSIDIICEDTEYCGIAIIELKIGGENYFEKSNGPLLAPQPLKNLNNSPRNQALLQLLVYRAMITENYPYVRVTRCYVLQARTDNIVLFGLTPQFIDAQASLIASLASRRSYDISRQRSGAAARGRPNNRGRPWSTRGKQWQPGR